MSGEPAGDFEDASRAVRIRYELLVGSEAAELRKWELAEESMSLADAQVLQGLKRARAVKDFELSLRRDGKATSHDSIGKLFKKGGVASMTGKVVSTMLKLADRFNAAPDATLAISDLDSLYGNGHSLANHSNLDVMCQKTSVRSDPRLQSALWLSLH